MFEKEKLASLGEELDKFNEKTEAALQKRPESKETFYTGSGDEVNRLYTPMDTAEFDYSTDLGMPGQFPYTRGVQPTMYRGRLWTMRMYAGFATAEESNKRYKILYLIKSIISERGSMLPWKIAKLQ